MAGYGDDAGFNTWLTANGYSLPVGAPSAAVLRQRGSGYIDATYGPRFYGVPTDVSQERAWPRSGARIYGQALASDLVPNRVIDASYQAAYLVATNPGSLSRTVDTGAQVKRERVEGAVEVEYFEPGKTAAGFITASVNSDIEGLLAPLISPISGIPGALVV